MSAALPVLSESGLSSYIAQANRFPMLEKQEEVALSRAWQEEQDVEAARKLVTSHLRLVVKIAMGFRGYGLPLLDLIGEGNIGLMQAVKKFDPAKGFRLSTYAMWWIKASIHEYILRSWSLVKVGTSASQKKLFFNLKRLKQRIAGSSNRALRMEEAKSIAHDLDVQPEEVVEMDALMEGHNTSLNASVDPDGKHELIEYLADENQDHENTLSQHQTLDYRRRLFLDAMQALNEREQDILQKRRLSEPSVTLATLSEHYGISQERVRQIENQALKKVTEAIHQNPQIEAA